MGNIKCINGIRKAKMERAEDLFGNGANSTITRISTSTVNGVFGILWGR